MIEAPACDFCPKGGMSASRAEVADCPLMADALHGVSQLTVCRNESVEIVFADFQQIRVLKGANRGSARTAAEQGHFTESVSLAELGNRAALIARNAKKIGDRENNSYFP